MNGTILAIDPGPERSAYVVYDPECKTVFGHGKMDNADIRAGLLGEYQRGTAHCVIERIASYGKPVGEEVFSTVIWIGRFAESWDRLIPMRSETVLLYRRLVKMHLCGAANAKDAHIRQRLIDIFGPGKEKAIGRKATPGPLYGIKADEWQALALAVTFAELPS